jgi:hypothetical protein
MNKLPMTAGGHSTLEGELTHRIRIERPRLIQRMQEAIADDSNLAENSEYQAAKADQEMNEARIAELEDKLARAEIIGISKLSGARFLYRRGATSLIPCVPVLKVPACSTCLALHDLRTGRRARVSQVRSLTPARAGPAGRRWRATPST